MPDFNFWNERWITGKTAFHQSDIHFSLTEFGKDLFDEKIHNSILVPLCGKSKDMNYLLSLGLKVFGIEFSSIAIENFFLESNIDYKVEILSNFEKLYIASNIVIYQGDLFKAKNFSVVNAYLEKVIYCYDRASMVAFDKNERIHYAKFLNDLPNLKNILLPLFDYGPRINEKKDVEVGPPYLVSEFELNQLYSSHFDIKFLKEKNLKVRESLALEGVTFEKELVYLLGRK